MSSDPERLHQTLETLRQMKFQDLPEGLLREMVAIESQHQALNERDVARTKLEKAIERTLDQGDSDA